LGRLMGTVAEVLSDKGGLVWPINIAPFQVHLVEVKSQSSNVKSKAEEIYKNLTNQNIEVLWDDRELSAGEKFADADLIGLPWRLVVSEKTLTAGKFELKNRRDGETKMIAEAAIAGSIK